VLSAQKEMHRGAYKIGWRRDDSYQGNSRVSRNYLEITCLYGLFKRRTRWAWSDNMVAKMTHH